jgi:hypothetical protein
MIHFRFLRGLLVVFINTGRIHPLTASADFFLGGDRRLCRSRNDDRQGRRSPLGKRAARTAYEFVTVFVKWRLIPLFLLIQPKPQGSGVGGESFIIRKH